MCAKVRMQGSWWLTIGWKCAFRQLDELEGGVGYYMPTCQLTPLVAEIIRLTGFGDMFRGGEASISLMTRTDMSSP